MQARLLMGTDQTHDLVLYKSEHGPCQKLGPAEQKAQGQANVTMRQHPDMGMYFYSLNAFM